MGSTAGLWDSRFDGTTSSKPSLIDQPDSRFIDDSGESVAFYKSRENDHDVDIGDILAATKSELPFIGPRFLTFDRRLGNGTSFQVNRELYTKPLEQPYYVAVKHLQPKSRAEHLKHLYANVMRELRVLMHPPLKGHPCFIPAIGYGWTNQPMADSRPYLVMDYSEQGTLDRYLTNISLLSRRQLRELALDVAVGIRELHRNGFIHGDVKSENILVFGSVSADRPHVAKLADFGAAFHRGDVEERGHRYLGTPRYNPPEMQDSWKKVPFVPGPMEDAVAKVPELSTFESYKRADVYSFGLLLWEIMHNGRSFFDPAWANPGETLLDCLRRMFENDTDELRRRLYDSFDQALDSIDDLSEEILALTVGEAFLICVRDIPKLRPDMEEVVKVLSAGTREGRPPPDYPLATTSPPSKALIPPPDDPAAAKAAGWKTDIRYGNGVQYRTAGDLKAPNPSSRPTGLCTLFKKPTSPSKQPFRHRGLSIFLIPTSVCPPWEVQCSMVRELKSDIAYEQDLTKKANAHLQLSVCYHIGFGIEPSILKVREHLHKSAEGNSVIAKSIKPHVEEAFDAQEAAQATTIGSTDTVSLNSFAARVRFWLRNTYRNYEEVDTYTNAQVRNDETVSLQILRACQEGQFDRAEQIAKEAKIYECREGATTPLHWLISFPPAEGERLANLLVKGITGSGANVGICAPFLDSMAEEPIHVPELCMELLGSPLHWAVRSRNLHLVRLLLHLGADVNLRWQGPPSFRHEPAKKQLPRFSALDIAVAFHFPEIVRELLHHGAETFGGQRRAMYFEGFPTIHMIAHPTQCFARYVIHGRHHRAALKETISVLKQHGLDINATDAWDPDESDPARRNTLSKGLENPALEEYILRELIDAGAAVDEIEPERDNAATFITRGCEDRPYDSKKLELVLGFVRDMNHVSRPQMNALHYCAVGGSVSMTEILLKTGKVDVNAREPEMHKSALFLASMHGHAAVAETLIRHGADIESSARFGETPLQRAVQWRHIDVVDILLRHDAKVRFPGISRNGFEENILHTAVMGRLPHLRTSAVGHVLGILNENPMISEQELVNEFDIAGWTPLHMAAYYGDVEGAKALLAAGADYKLKDRRSYKDLRSGTPCEIARNNLMDIDENGIDDGFYEWLDSKDHAAINYFKNSLQEIWRILANLDLKDSAEERPVHEHE